MNEYYKNFIETVLLMMEQTDRNKLQYDFDIDGISDYKRLHYNYDNKEYWIRMYNQYENGDIDFSVYTFEGTKEYHLDGKGEVIVGYPSIEVMKGYYEKEICSLLFLA